MRFLAMCYLQKLKPPEAEQVGYISWVSDNEWSEKLSSACRQQSQKSQLAVLMNNLLAVT